MQIPTGSCLNSDLTTPMGYIKHKTKAILLNIQCLGEPIHWLSDFFYLTLILLRLFQQHYCYNVTGQSQESEGSCKPARIKEVHSKLHSFQASLCTLTATHLTLIYVCTYIRLSVPLGCLIKQAGIIIHTILNMWETPGIEPVTSDLTSVYQISSSTN